MTDKIKIEADTKLARVLYEMSGLSIAVAALGADEPKSALPGFRYALALVEKELADMRAQMAVAAFRLAASHGHDIAKFSGCHTIIERGKFFVELTPADLVDQAED